MDPDPQLFFLLKPDPGVKNVKITEKSNEIDKNCNLTKNVNGVEEPAHRTCQK